jgi:hypothetical protein
MKRLNRLPKARTGYQVQGALVNDVPAFGGADYNAYIGKPSPQVRKTMGAVPREEANLEAEGGETLVGDIDGSTFPSFFSIKGPRHSEGGVPMNLPDDTFIFSDTATMKITDPKILKMFNKSPKKGGYTPAELSKSYDINKYRKLLQDPESNKMEKKTAEMMIKNYVMKLGALAIAQESKKGFPQGIPVIAKPYMEANKITEADLIPEIAKQQQEQQQMMAQQQGAPQEQMMEAPTEMPSGEPIAQPTEEGMQGAPQMSEEDMMAMQQQDPSQMQQAPMAMYGMSMGGYEMPFAQNGGWNNKDMINNSPNFYIPNKKDLNRDILKRKYPNSPIGQNTQILQSDSFNTTENVPQIPMPQQQYGGDMYDIYNPKAAYGMAMGVNSNNYMGRTKRIPGSGPFLNREMMAKEGLIVGGMLGMPLIMSEGGLIDMYDDGGSKKKKTKEQLEKEIKEKKYKDNIKKVKEFEKDVEVFDVDGKKIGARGTSAEQQKDLTYNKRKNPYVYNKGREEAYIKGLCERMKNGDLQGYTVADLVKKNLIVAAAGSKLAGCETKSKEDVTEFFELEEPETGCQCEDPNKPGYQEKDENGKCPCEVEKCYCINPETGQEEEKPLTDGKCICEEEESASGFGAAQPSEIPMAWTPQDERNMATALRTRTGIEYPTAMTYQYPEVELAKEEWLSKVQALQGQGAKNLDVMSRTAGPSTAKQAAAASLEGDIAEQTVNAIANTQARNVGTENQERSMNYQGDVAEGQNRQNILNQYMDKVGAVRNNYRGELNAKDALVTQMMNQGDTNAANIYNLQTEQYGIDPRTGKRIFKSGKPLEPTKPGQDAIEYAQSLEEAGLPEGVQEILLKQQFSKFGGRVLQMGGMVYGDNVYPFFYYG